MKVLVKVCVFLVMSLTTRLDAATVVLYHHVSDTSPKSTSVTVEQFQQHLALIEELGLTVVPLPTLIQAIRAGESVNPNWLAITFDDGYRNVYDNAFPLLKEKNWPFTVFVNPDMVKPSKLYMDWEQLKELTQFGGDIMNHTLAHENLVDGGLSIQAIERNLLAAEQAIVEHLGQNHKMLAYPFGEYDAKVKALLKKHDFIGFAQHSGAINETSDLQALTRFPANGIYANPKTLRNKLKSLAFSIKSHSPEDTKPESLTPEWQVELVSKDFYQSMLSCFVTGQDKPIKPKWHTDLSFSVQTQEEIGSGRIKYNCTAPSIRHSGRYYWMSKLWIRP